MATQVKFRRDTRANLLLSTPVEGEIGVDTTNDRLILGDGSTSGGIPQASYADIQNQKYTAVDGVGTDTITLTLDDAPTAYAEYQAFTFKPAANNTGAVTLNINSLGAKNVKKDDGSGVLVDLEADDMKANIPVNVIYDGVQFILQLGGGASGTYVLLSDVDASNDATIEFDNTIIDGTYSRYEFHLFNVLPVGNGNFFQARLSTDGGSTFVSTSSYNHVASAGTVTGGSQTVINIVNNNGSNAGSGVTAVLVLYNPARVTGDKHLRFEAFWEDSSATSYAGLGYVSMDSGVFTTNDINGIQFFESSGNISSGNFKVYGVT